MEVLGVKASEQCHQAQAIASRVLSRPGLA